MYNTNMKFERNVNESVRNESSQKNAKRKFVRKKYEKGFNVDFGHYCCDFVPFPSSLMLFITSDVDLYVAYYILENICALNPNKVMFYYRHSHAFMPNGST